MPERYASSVVGGGVSGGGGWWFECSHISPGLVSSSTTDGFVPIDVGSPRLAGERLADVNVRRHRFGGGNVMVWGGNSAHHRTPVYELDDNISD